MIEFKNIDLNKINFFQQGDKVIEERKEFTDAAAYYIFRGTEENKQHMIEEFYDMVQAGLGLMQKAGIDAKEVMKYYPKHLEKIKNRPRSMEDGLIKEKERCIDEVYRDKREITKTTVIGCYKNTILEKEVMKGKPLCKFNNEDIKEIFKDMGPGMLNKKKLIGYFINKYRKWHNSYIKDSVMYDEVILCM